MKLHFTLILNLTYLTLIAQQNTDSPDPEIGKPFPPYEFKEFQNFNKNIFNTTEAKGKWLILDFWNQECASCINSFPEINRIATTYKKQIQLISIGYTGSMGFDYPNSIRHLFKVINSKYHFTFPVAFDSILYNKLEIGGVGSPYIIIIDTNGIVRAVTHHLKYDDINDVLNGNYARLSPIRRQENLTSKTFDIDSTKGFYSIQFYRDEALGAFRPVLRYDSSTSDFLNITGVPLAHLYRYAYTGTAYWSNYYDSLLYTTFQFHPILRVKDSSDFTKHKYSFHVKLPRKISKIEMMSLLRTTLANSLGFKVEIKEGEFPYWKVLVIDSLKSKLSTKGDKFYFSQPNGKFLGFEAKNIPIRTLIAHLAANFQIHRDNENCLPFVDETGLTSNIDVTIDAFTKNFEEFKNALLKNGIKIVKGRKRMRYLLISHN